MWHGQESDEMAGEDHHDLSLHMNDRAARSRVTDAVEIPEVPIAPH